MKDVFGRSAGWLREVSYQNCLQADGTSLFFAPCDRYENKQLFWYQWDYKLVRSAYDPTQCLSKDYSDQKKVILGPCPAAYELQYLDYYSGYALLLDMKFSCTYLPGFPGVDEVCGLFYAIRSV